MNKQTPTFNFSATGIGSVPFLDIEKTCRNILDLFPTMPFWPQFVKRSFMEDMSAQYCEGLPLVRVDEDKRTISISTAADAEAELTAFYEHFLAQDTDYFAIGRNRAPGLYTLLEMVGQNPQKEEALYIKGQSVGPVTFAAGILDTDERPLIHNTELLEAMVNGLAIKALWQVRELQKTGRKPILFLDEPYLTGFGSAFTSIQRHEVIQILQTVINYVRENSDALMGIHCCGNTDWPMIVEAGPDIINFDAFEFMDHFLLYPKELSGFIDNGGAIAWGIVPTAGFTGKESVSELLERMKQGLARMCQWGITPEEISSRSLFTPACGMGSMDAGAAENVMNILAGCSKQKKAGV